MTSSRADTSATAHTPAPAGGNPDSKRQRLAKIAGQLGAAVAPSFLARPYPHTEEQQQQRKAHASSPFLIPSSSSSSSPANERLLAISKQLGGALFSSASPSSSSSIPRPRTTNPHLTPHDDAKQWEKLPKFRDLPSEGGWPGCAWDVWGRGDQLGCLNLLTDAVRAQAAKEEIRTGHAISLSWPLHLPAQPGFGRKALTHRRWGKPSEYYASRRTAAVEARRGHAHAQVDNRSEAAAPLEGPVCDDEIHINTQSGSQWDGFSHFGHLALDCFYQGRTRQEVQRAFEQPAHAHEDEGVPALGIQAWAKGGIAGRGVLLDVWGWLTRKHDGAPPYDPTRSHALTLDTLTECARAQGVRFRQGDVLLIRTGWIQAYNEAPDEGRRAAISSGREGYVGVEQGEHVLEWLWDNHFAAVASDCPAFERWPCPLGQTHLHETLLALFGMPIGELFDLEALTEHCQRTRRWTFYFSSWPLNLHGGVASTANAGATF